MKHPELEQGVVAGESTASTTDHHNKHDPLEQARRRLVLATGGTIALSSVSRGWHSPIVESVVLPAHAQTTDDTDDDTTPVGVLSWAYDNTAPISSPVVPFETANGSGPCGSIFGPTNVGGVFVRFGCNSGPFQITSWFVDGVDVVGSPVQFNGSGEVSETASCPQFLQNFANAMNSVDPHSSWEQTNDGTVPADGGCANYVRSLGTVDTIVYGTMILVDTNTSAQWVLNPTIV